MTRFEKFLNGKVRVTLEDGSYREFGIEEILPAITDLKEALDKLNDGTLWLSHQNVDDNVSIHNLLQEINKAHDNLNHTRSQINIFAFTVSQILKTFIPDEPPV